MHRNAEAQVTAAHEKAEELRLDLGDARVSGERATARVRTLENQVITMSQSMEQQETKFQVRRGEIFVQVINPRPPRPYCPCGFSCTHVWK